MPFATGKQTACLAGQAGIALQKGLDKLKTYKKELLVVLENPKVPLHNNQSESDIREYVKKRKISGSTRSENGRKARDTFASLKKTCRKMKISFWDYLNDRLTSANKIQYLPDLLITPNDKWKISSLPATIEMLRIFLVSLYKPFNCKLSV